MRWTRWRTWVVLAVGAVATLPAVALAPAAPVGAAPPEGFQTTLVVGDGLDGPSGFEIAPDGRIFVLERSGKIKIVKDGELLATPFADLPSENTGDRGLIGIAFDPEFGVANHFVYFYYTGHDLLNHLVRFNADEDVADGGPLELFRTSSPSTLLHVGGSIRFGPDGKLYFAVGDNGQGSQAQDLSNPHGKILRINRDGSIPADNPFADQPGRLGAIWAYGFRNPWRFQFDSVTGRLYGGDVGDFSWEEVNLIQKGANYGWPVHEGTCQSSCAGYTDPVHVYPHAGESAAVTGGPVYRGAMFPDALHGDLFFADYAKGFIRTADLAADGSVTQVSSFDEQAGSVVDLKVAPDGSLYYLTYWPGALYRVTYDSSSSLPVAAAGADVTKGVEPLTVSFSSAGSGDPDGDPLAFHWDFGDGTSSTDPHPTKTYDEVGVYTARLTVTAGGDRVSARPVVIQVGIAPDLIVAAPTEGQQYRAGDTITFNAFATDAAGFDLDDAGIKTEVRLHHGSHFHPFVGPLTGRAGSFTIPDTGEASADTSYQVTVTATDTNGLSATKTVTIVPRTSEINLRTDPPGLGLQVDSISVITPRTFSGVEGFKRELAAPTHAVAEDGTPLQFAGWSDGKAVRHVITTPTADTTYTATYVPQEPFTARYYATDVPAGTPVLTRQDPTVNFAWGSGSPDPTVPANWFSARWTKTQHFGTGRYRFTAVADDGMRLYIDGVRVMSSWNSGANAVHTHVADLYEGMHRIKMEYVERGGDATASLHWDSVAEQSTGTYRAQYWNAPGSNTIPSTAPQLVRDEEAIDHDWEDGSPGSGITPNRFVARWDRTIHVVPGDYEFTVTADDGARLIVDGVVVVDAWVDQGPTTYTATVPLDGGPHDVVMEYYENGGGATARMSYTAVGDLPVDEDYQGEYWDATDESSFPSIPNRPADLVRTDETLDFDWSDGSPAPGLPDNRFVARWTKSVFLSAGVYRFTGGRDDGLRVYVDGVPVLDQWTYGNEDYSVDKVITGGPHELRVEYFESGGGARASLDYTRVGDVVAVTDGYTAEYFDNRDLAGEPVVTRTEDRVDHVWSDGSPADGVPANNFSARWTQELELDEAGAHEFTVTTDDGSRLYVDGQLVLDRWVPQSATTHTVTRHLAAGTHELVLEYFEAGGDAVARFSHTPTDEEPPPEPEVEPFSADYFDNPTLSGDPVLSRDDDGIDFDWEGTAPAPTLPDNQFSARWTRTKTYPAGTYRFTVTGDDGIRVLVDGTEVIDGWAYQPPTTYTAEVDLTEGEHTVVVEYFEWSGGAVARYTEERLP